MSILQIVTMALIVLSYQLNIVRYGTMWMALFDLRWGVVSVCAMFTCVPLHIPVPYNMSSL